MHTNNQYYNQPPIASIQSQLYCTLSWNDSVSCPLLILWYAIYVHHYYCPPDEYVSPVPSPFMHSCVFVFIAAAWLPFITIIHYCTALITRLLYPIHNINYKRKKSKMPSKVAYKTNQSHSQLLTPQLLLRYSVHPSHSINHISVLLSSSIGCPSCGWQPTIWCSNRDPSYLFIIIHHIHRHPSSASHPFIIPFYLVLLLWLLLIEIIILFFSLITLWLCSFVHFIFLLLTSY
jgi:hypothetical protein